MTLRIGIVTYDFYPQQGGQGRFTFDLWRRLTADPRLDVSVFSPSVNELFGHHLVGAAAAHLGKHLGFSLAVAAALSHWREAFGIDVFHFNGGPGGVLLLRDPPAPLVYTAHHTYAQQARFIAGQSWKRSLGSLETRGYRKAAVIAADTPSTATAVIAEAPDLASRVRVIPPGVDTNQFRPVELDKLPGSVLFVGRLDARKGIDFLLSAWRLLVRDRAAARLYIIGDGPLRLACDRFIARHGLADTVVFLGRVSEDELISWYNRAWCVVVPSVFEGFGLSALEALACGTPIVATDSDGLRDVVGEGDGTLVPYGAAPALAQALDATLARDGCLPHKRVKEIAERYNWAQIASRYTSLYHEIAGAPP